MTFVNCSYLRIVMVTGLFATGLPINVMAGEADVIGVKATTNGSTWNFDVSVLHADAGWEHYADKWDVVAPDGKVLATRMLAHPHENEQPFTRSLSNVEIPLSISSISIRAHDSVHGYGGKEMTVELKR